ncbi:unnamed protein product, partial [Polarella glacialis]
VRIRSTKRDVNWAFKWHHLDPENVPEFATRLAGIININLVVTFGWCGFPGEYMCWAWAANAQHKSYTPPDPGTNDVVPYVSKWLIGDPVILEPVVGVRAHLSMAVLERAMIDVWWDLAVNAEQKEEEGDLAETQLLWCLSMDLANFTISLSSPKIIKAKHLLAEPSLRRVCKELKVKLVQELQGSAQYWTTAQPEFHPELAVLDLMLNQAERTTWVNPKWDERTVEATWANFGERLALPEAEQKVKWIGGDAVMDRGGGRRTWHYIGGGVVTFIAFAAAEAGNWHDKSILYVNGNVRAWPNKRRTKNRLDRNLIRLLKRLKMENRCTTTGLHIRAYRNELSDWLTRKDEDEVHRKMAEAGWTRIPSPACWLETVRDASRHVLRLPREKGGPSELAAQLAHTAEAIPRLPLMRAQGSLWDENQGTMISYTRDGRPIRGILVDMPRTPEVGPEYWLRAGHLREGSEDCDDRGPPLLPRLVGHFRNDGGKKFLVHSPNGPNTTGGYSAGSGKTLLLIDC